MYQTRKSITKVNESSIVLKTLNYTLCNKANLYIRYHLCSLGICLFFQNIFDSVQPRTVFGNYNNRSS